MFLTRKEINNVLKYVVTNTYFLPLMHAKGLGMVRTYSNCTSFEKKRYMVPKDFLIRITRVEFYYE